MIDSCINFSTTTTFFLSQRFPLTRGSVTMITIMNMTIIDDEGGDVTE